MQRHVDRQQQVAGWSFAGRRTALAAKTNLRSIRDSGRDLHLDPMHLAVRVLNADFGLASLNRRLKRDFDFALNIGPAIFGAAAAAFARLCTSAEAAE